MTHSAESLSPSERGRWLVVTQGSRHVWDLDAMTYQRLPGAGRASFPHDAAVVRITRVERWPVVGLTSFIWFDDPLRPESLEHWRQSSVVVSIERLPDTEGPLP